MSIPLDAIDLSAATVGTTGSINWASEMARMGGGPAPSGRPAFLQAFNESGCGLRVTIGGNGYRLTAGAWMLIPIRGSDTTMSYTVEYVIGNAQVTQLLLVLYGPGEPIPSTPILGNSPVGGTVTTNTAQQVVNDGNPAATHVVEATVSGDTSSSVLIENEGQAFFKQAIQFGGVIGGASPTNGGIQYNPAVAPGSGETVIFSPSDSSPQDFLFTLWNGTQSVNVFQLGVNSSGTPTCPYIDASGLLHLIAPPTLISGNQETGMCGGGMTMAAAAQYFEPTCNFKTVLTSTPTSVTLTVSRSGNLGAAVSAVDLSTHGFTIIEYSAAAGFMSWIGTYTTVGNCLLSVDAAARTFSHHCEHCGHVSSAVALSALRTDTHNGTTPGAVAIAYDCPSCGSVEAFNSGLSAHDEQDTTPQGTGQYATTRGAQARMIRQLQALLSLPVK